MNYVIEEYSPQQMEKRDIDHLAALYRQLFEKNHPERADAITYEDVSLFLKAGHMWVARADDVIVSMGCLIPHRKLIVSETFGAIHDIATDVKHRGQVQNKQSLATVILREMIRFARWHRYKYLELTSSPDRVAANKLYQKLCFRLIANANQDDQAGTNLYRLYLKQTVTI